MILVGIVCVDRYMSRKKGVEESGAVGRARMSRVCRMFSNPIDFNGSRAFSFNPVEMNPLISKTRAVGQSLMSVAILPLIAKVRNLT